MSRSYLPLLAAIVLEVIATSALQASQQFTRPWPTAVMALGYLAAFFFLSLALRGIPVGIAYAIWSGLGIVLISAVGWVVFGQKLDMPAIIGLGLILAGVLVVNLFSGTARH
ncbi:DMT family transporter [Roseomonas marmotae]|uniref:Multidrug efflux SMR transporter n=1 Tax=Roseomonas marmotae TaxID=2768161 RepID=A0ABS3KBA7_9PROT|nr:multidrug efflux SMR transporter [Roseomonas marmotae]MBO1074752.1 multidrug efflux SMR transporter [Roseomonas marmotae]QTI77788.1 multidrug efflux SMR transporter [Roseomonas marmotae]